MMSFVTIYYKTKDLQTIRKIQERFGFPKRMTVNGECTVIVDGKAWEVLKSVEQRGFIEIRNKEIKEIEATELFTKRIADGLREDKDLEIIAGVYEQQNELINAVCRYVLSEVRKVNKRDWAIKEIHNIAKQFIYKNK